MPPTIHDLHVHRDPRADLLAVNNASARETSFLSMERFDQMIAAANVATFVAPADALLLAFEQDDPYDGGHFQWFRARYDRFLYIDRIVIAASQRRRGLGLALYQDLFARAARLGHTRIACEVNALPPNPVSDAFHAALGFEAVGEAVLDEGRKRVRYLLKTLA